MSQETIQINVVKRIRGGSIEYEPEPLIPVETELKTKCHKCRQLLFKGSIGEGTAIEVQCSRCGEKNRIAKP